MVKKYDQFIEEAAHIEPPAPAAPGSLQKPVQQNPPPQAQKPVQQSPAQPAPATQKPAQQGQQATQTDEKLGDLSNYNNPDVTKHPDTVKNMVAQIKDMTKDQLIALRDFIAQQKDIDDPKTVIGKL